MCCYDAKPSGAKKASRRPPAAKAQPSPQQQHSAEVTDAPVSQGAAVAGPSSAFAAPPTYAPTTTLGELPANSACAWPPVCRVRVSARVCSRPASSPTDPPIANPYLTSFPLTTRNDSYESLAAAYFAPAPAPTHTPTPPLSYSSAASPEDSVFAHSPPDQHSSISRPPSVYGTYSTAGPAASSSNGFHLPPILAAPSASYAPYNNPQPQYHTTSNPLAFAPPPPSRESPAWAGQATAASHGAYVQRSYDDAPAPARPSYGYSYTQQPTSAYPSPLPRIEPYGSATASPAQSHPVAPAYTAKRPKLPLHLPPPRLSSNISSAFASPAAPHVHAQTQHQQQPHVSHGAEDPTFSLPLQQQHGTHLGAVATPGFAPAPTRSPFPAYAGGITPWPTLPSPSAPVTWAYPTGAAGGGGGGAGKLATTPGYGHVDEWLRGLAT